MRHLLVATSLLGLLAFPAHATWSIVAVDTETQEVGVAAATCVTGLDLRAVLPAIVVGVGGGCAQSQQDSTGTRRTTMVNGWNAGQTSDQIMTTLAALSGSSLHQNGLADAGGDEATFTGASCSAHASGVVGNIGTLRYAIQGNIVTGRAVITEAELALRNTVGDLPARLMAAMEAARAMGGDGRCSCPGSITGCGAPPPSFTKSAHVGFLILSRYGDTNGACNSTGCARGNYFLNLNVPNQTSGATDPVIQLRSLFNTWRAGLAGRPDAITSTVGFAPSGSGQLLTLTLKDWQGNALGFSVNSVTVAHAPGSAGVSAIGPVQNLGGGVYQVLLTPQAGTGVDRFQITIEDGVRAVVIPPKRASLTVGTPPLFADNFDGAATGWVVNAGGTDTATSGAWEIGDPEGTTSSGTKQLGTTQSGTRALVTGRLAGSSAGSFDVDGGVTSARSGPIALPSAASTVTLRLWSYLAHGSNASSADFLRIQVIGTTTATLYQQLGAATNRNGAWTQQTLDLTAFKGQTVRLQVECADASGASLVECGVDTVSVTVP
jgi:Family of unknown function (DUF1028)